MGIYKGALVEVIHSGAEHLFFYGEVVTVIEVLDDGYVLARNSDGIFGVVAVEEYSIIA